MQNTQILRLKKRVTVTLSGGHRIIVIGWKDSNHNKQTRELAKTKQILFREVVNRDLRGKDDLIMMTRFVTHSSRDAIKKTGIPVYPHSVKIGFIKNILAEFYNLVVPEEKPLSSLEIQGSQDICTEKPETCIDELEKSIISTEVKVDQYDKLATRFSEQSESHSDKLVGARTLGVILREINLDKTTRELTRNGWIIPFTREGKTKIGWYRAGEKLTKRLEKDINEEPADGIEKAQYLINRKPYFEENLNALRERMKHWEEQLERVKSAEMLLKQLSDI